jgi:threonylcarbamoyladenosine tRNA methylthiotransferase MtaB
MKKVAILTLGCKLNQAESALIHTQYQKANFEVVTFPALADIYVINTCSVTARADYKSRQLIRRVKRNNQRALIVVTGCYAQRAPNEIKKILSSGLILGNKEKADIVKYTHEVFSQKKTLSETIVIKDTPDEEKKALPLIPAFPHRTRAFIKIQDGCQKFCTYCVVPLVRNHLQSESPKRILTQCEILIKHGVKEIVLTGANLGAYFSEGVNLPMLLRQIVKLPHLTRLRLSSLEPEEFTPELLEVFTEMPQLCPHFHLPLQSGSKEILKRMNRGYTPSDYQEIVLAIKKSLPEANIGADIIVGFPGETLSCFEETYRLVARLPLSYFHVFCYSPREGTKSSKDKETLSQSEKKRRAEALRELSQKKNYLFRKNFENKIVEVLTEGQGAVLKGLTRNYIRVNFPNTSLGFSNQLRKAKIEKVSLKGTEGRLI